MNNLNNLRIHQRTHHGTEYGTIKNETSQDQIRSLPAELLKQKGSQGSKGERPNATPTHSNPSGQRSFSLKVVSHSNHSRQVNHPEADS